MNLKNKKFLIIASISIVSIGLVSFIFYKVFHHQNSSNNFVKKNEYTVIVNGAVKNPGSYKFNKPKTIREIVFTANALTNADLDSLELDRVINNDEQIIVPYKVGTIKKIKWKDLNSVEQLTDLGVKNSVAQIIIKHRRENETTTWEEILALKGIGPVTLSQLKDIIDLS